MSLNKGRIFRNGSGENTPKIVYAKAIQNALRSELAPIRGKNKIIQRWTGARERTINNWLSGQCGPRGEHLLLLACHSERVFETMLALADREDFAAGMHIQKIFKEIVTTMKSLEIFLKDSGSISRISRTSRMHRSTRH